MKMNRKTISLIIVTSLLVSLFAVFTFYQTTKASSDQSIFGDYDMRAAGGYFGWHANQNGQYDFGTRFYVDIQGDVTKARMYAYNGQTGSHTVKIWNADTSTVIAGPYNWDMAPGQAEGWREYTLPQSVTIYPNINYMVSITPALADGGYAYLPNVFTTNRVSGHITFPVNGGRYATSPGAMPHIYEANYACYLRDIAFVPYAPTPTPTPEPTPTPQPSQGQSIFDNYDMRADGGYFGWYANQTGQYDFGTRFYVDIEGDITKARMYAYTGETGSHTVKIWNADTSTVIAGPYNWDMAPGQAEGWREYTLPQPVTIYPNINYMVSITPALADGGYAYLPNVFTTNRVSGHITFPVNGSRYATSPGAMPHIYEANYASYLRDIEFVPDYPVWDFRAVSTMNITRDRIYWIEPEDIGGCFTDTIQTVADYAVDVGANYLELPIMPDQKDTLAELLPYYVVLPEIARESGLGVYFRVEPRPEQLEGMLYTTGQEFKDNCRAYFDMIETLWVDMYPGLLRDGDVVSTFAEGDSRFTTPLGWSAGVAKYREYLAEAALFIDRLRTRTGLDLIYTESVCGGEGRLQQFTPALAANLDFISWDHYIGVEGGTEVMRAEAIQMAQWIEQYSQSLGTKIALGEWCTHWYEPKTKAIQAEYMQILAEETMHLSSDVYPGMMYFHFALPLTYIDYENASGPYFSSPVIDATGPFPAYYVLQEMFMRHSD